MQRYATIAFWWYLYVPAGSWAVAFSHEMRFNSPAEPHLKRWLPYCRLKGLRPSLRKVGTSCCLSWRHPQWGGGRGTAEALWPGPGRTEKKWEGGFNSLPFTCLEKTFLSSKSHVSVENDSLYKRIFRWFPVQWGHFPLNQYEDPRNFNHTPQAETRNERISFINCRGYFLDKSEEEMGGRFVA